MTTAIEVGYLPSLSQVGGFIHDMVVPVSNATNHDAFWQAAIDAVRWTGGIVFLPDGHYWAPSIAVQMYDNVSFWGQSEDNVIVQRLPNSNRECFNVGGFYDVTIREMTLDGNYAENHTALGGQTGELEMSTIWVNGALRGGRNKAIRVKIRNFNLGAISYGGDSNEILYCTIEGIEPLTYHPWNDVDFQSLLGLYVAGSAYCSDMKIIGNHIRGTRSGGVSIGGYMGLAEGNTVEQCHRGVFVTHPGGMFNTCMTLGTNGVPSSARTRDWTIRDNIVGPSVAVEAGAMPSCFEFDGADDCTFEGNRTIGVTGGAYQIHDCHDAKIDGGYVGYADYGINAHALAGDTPAMYNRGLIVQNLTIDHCGVGVHLDEHLDDWTFVGVKIKGSTRHDWVDDSHPTIWTCIGTRGAGPGPLPPVGQSGGGPPLDFTPLLSQGVAVSFDRDYCHVRLDGKDAHIMARVVATSAGTPGQPIRLGFPSWLAGAHTDPGTLLGEARFVKSGVKVCIGAAVGVTGACLQRDEKGDVLGSVFDPLTIGANDSMTVNVSYELQV